MIALEDFHMVGIFYWLAHLGAFVVGLCVIAFLALVIGVFIYTRIDDFCWSLYVKSWNRSAARTNQASSKNR